MFSWRYIVVAIFLVIIAFLASLFIFPDWAGSNRLILALIVLIISQTVNFLANFRTAFEPRPQIQATPPDSRRNLVCENQISFSPLHQLPPITRDFTGRTSELTAIGEQIRTNKGNIVIIRGFGGIGKTTLAIKVAHETKDLFPDAQFVADLRGTSSEPLSFEEVIGSNYLRN